jgi:2,3-bisphosphoglycerate-dependent phosphoglycerate mutase
MELFLIRHGQSANNVLEDVSLRDKDPELTELGQRQAARVAEFLVAGGHKDPHPRREGLPFFDHLYCSPMLRAMQTAEPIGRGLGIDPEIWVDIHEMGGIYLDHGEERGVIAYPGQTRGEMGERFPGYRLPEGVGEDGWWKGDGMESFAAGQGRAIGVASALKERAGSDERICLVSHGGYMSCLLQALGRQLPAEGFYYEHGNTAITRLCLSADGFVTLFFSNRVDHLSERELS